MRWVQVLVAGVAVCAVACAGLGFVFRAPIFSVVDALQFAMEEPDWAELDGADRFVEYLLAHPDDFSLMVYSADADGQPLPDTVVSHNADTPRSLASTVKIVVLSALARAIDEGAIDPDEAIPLVEWESWYLHGTDGGAHPAAYDDLGIAHREGIATDPKATATVLQIAERMIKQSDNAATDTLIDRLGDRLHAETDRLGHPRIQPLLADTFRATSDDPCGTAAPDLFDPAVRKARLAEGIGLPPIRAQRDAFVCADAQGTARIYAAVMAGVVSRTHISESASATMDSLLDWPMDFPNNKKRYDAFGTKGGSVPGVITEASYLVPKSGAAAGQRRVVVVFVNRMSGSAWLANMGSYAHQDLGMRLATEPDFADAFRK